MFSAGAAQNGAQGWAGSLDTRKSWNPSPAMAGAHEASFANQAATPPLQKKLIRASAKAASKSGFNAKKGLAAEGDEFHDLASGPARLDSDGPDEILHEEAKKQGARLKNCTYCHGRGNGGERHTAATCEDKKHNRPRCPCPN